MNMKITTLIENRPSKTDPRLVAEWGLSLHIAFNGQDILFDTGTSGSFAKNAELLSIDMASVNTAILSHHHFDHGGGLGRFFELNSSAKVYLGAMPDGDCFSKFLGFTKKYVGLDKTLMTDYANRFEPVDKLIEILPDVFVTSHITDSYPKPAGNKRLYLRKNGAFTLDNFSHEIVMAIKENGKLVVFTGCSHHGIVNMVDSIAQEFKGVPIRAVVGGFHLIAMPPFNWMADNPREIDDLARQILNYPVETTYTGHCTSAKAFRVLKTVMGERLVDIQTGSRFEI